MADLTPEQSGIDFANGAGLRLDVELASSFLKVAGLETRAAVLGIFTLRQGMTAGNINQTMNSKQDNDPLWTPSDAYYPDICIQFTNPKHPYFQRSQVQNDKGKLVHEYQLTPLGHVARGVGGQLLKWGIDSNLSLRGVLGDATTAGGEPSMLVRIALLGTARRDGVVHADKTIKGLEKVPEKAMKRVCGHLATSGLFEANGDKFYPNPEYSEQVDELMQLVKRMILVEPDFYDQGQVLADEVVNQPTRLRALIKRAEVSSTRSAEKRNDYIGLCDGAVRMILHQNRAMSTGEILERFAAGLEGQPRHNFLAVLKKDPRIQFTSRSAGDRLFYPANHEYTAPESVAPDIQ